MGYREKPVVFGMDRSDVSSISMIPAMSTASNMVFVNGYTEADGWEVTGLDWGTGATSHRVIRANQPG